MGTVADNLAAGRAVPGLALAVAGWMRYVGGIDEGGNPIEVKDPLAARLRSASDGAEGAEGKVAALLAVQEVFDPALAANAAFRDAVLSAYVSLTEVGAKATVGKFT